MWKRACFLGLLGLPLVLGSGKRDDLTKNCSDMFTVPLGNFLPDISLSDSPQESGEYGHVLPWPDFSRPMTFYVRTKSDVRTSTDVVLALQLESSSSGNLSLTNCYLSKFCTDILTCCYDHLLPEQFSSRYQKSCPPSKSCRGGRATPCEATCFRDMRVNLAFTKNKPGFGGNIHVSVDFKVSVLTQSQEPYLGEMFMRSVDDEVYIRKKVERLTSASTINTKVITGFWVRYVKERTRLLVGLDGKHEPVVQLELWDHPLMLTSGINSTYNNRDSYGWFGDEVYQYPDVFSPDQYRFNIPGDGVEVSVAANCSNIMYTTWGQVQMSPGGSCLTHMQCPEEYVCEPDYDGPRELSWIQRKACFKEEGSFFSENWVVVINVSTVALMVMTGIGTYFLYNNDNNKKRVRNYLKPMTRKKRRNEQIKEVDSSDESVIRGPARKSQKLQQLMELHDFDLNRVGGNFASEDKKSKAENVANRRKQERHERRKALRDARRKAYKKKLKEAPGIKKRRMRLKSSTAPRKTRVHRK